jgi:sugar phosphate isomerase/epimerase
MYGADLVQISVYKGQPGALGKVRDIAARCREEGVPFVVHPVMYSLLDTVDMEMLKESARAADLALILHDEQSPGGGRVGEGEALKIINALEELSSIARVSIENALDTADAPWFWGRFARESITLDIGHVEAAGLDSVRFVSELDQALIEKIEFVHMHRNGEFRSGLTDHWPLEPGCRELKALEALLKRKRDVSVILEINEREGIKSSLELVRGLG